MWKKYIPLFLLLLILPLAAFNCGGEIGNTVRGPSGIPVYTIPSSPNTGGYNLCRVDGYTLTVTAPLSAEVDGQKYAIADGAMFTLDVSLSSQDGGNCYIGTLGTSTQVYLHWVFQTLYDGNVNGQIPINPS